MLSQPEQSNLFPTTIKNINKVRKNMEEPEELKETPLQVGILFQKSLNMLTN